MAGRVADAVPLLPQAMEQSIATEMSHHQALCRLSLGEAHLLAGRLEEAHALAERALALPVSTRNGATRRMPCASSATSRRGASLRSASGLKPTTGKPSPWPTNSACAPSGPLPPQPRYPVRHDWPARAGPCRAIDTAMTLYRAMEMTFWLPQAEAALAQVEGGENTRAG